MMHISRGQARRFMLLKQGLLGLYRFHGAQGIVDYVRQAGCVQFDPVDVCGKSAEIALQSRVEGFAKPLLSGQLYESRALIDYFDKNLAIIPIEDWPCFERMRASHRAWERSHAEIEAVRSRVRDMITERGPMCSADMGMNEKVSWYWSDTRLSRAALEHMYFTGELAVHHKRGSVKYYDLAERLIPADILKRPDPYPDDSAHLRWRAQRRVGAVGLMWERASDAWLGMEGFTAAERASAFENLRASGAIVPLEVEGIRWPLHMLSADLPLLERALHSEFQPRAELMAPLDCMLWDRKLIAALFDFEYKWEIYTPAEQRKYGYYVLPVLCGESFMGRVELARDSKRSALEVKRIWYEDGRAPGRSRTKLLRGCIERFARFNGCTAIDGIEKI